MSLTLKEVEKVARLARLALTEAEKRRFQAQLSAVLDHVDMLRELDLEGVEPAAHAVSMQNVMREDIVAPSLPLEDVLFNAPKQEDEQFRIQPILP